MSFRLGRGQPPPEDRWVIGLAKGPCGKYLFPSRNQAKRRIRHLVKGPARRDSRERAALLHAYYCDRCGAWHIGHDRPRPAAKRDAS